MKQLKMRVVDRREYKQGTQNVVEVTLSPELPADQQVAPVVSLDPAQFSANLGPALSVSGSVTLRFTDHPDATVYKFDKAFPVDFQDTEAQPPTTNAATAVDAQNKQGGEKTGGANVGTSE